MVEPKPAIETQLAWVIPSPACLLGSSFFSCDAEDQIQGLVDSRLSSLLFLHLDALCNTSSISWALLRLTTLEVDCSLCSEHTTLCSWQKPRSQYKNYLEEALLELKLYREDLLLGR